MIYMIYDVASGFGASGTVLPSMIIASSVVSPFSSGEPPRPTDPSQPHSMPEKGCRFSQKLQPISTASAVSAGQVLKAGPTPGVIRSASIRAGGCPQKDLPHHDFEQ